MKIVVTGKGGSGKTTISGALARQLARGGRQVVAIDADPNPNLGIALGMARPDMEALVPILNGLLAAGHTHDDPTPEAEELMTRFGAVTGDGVRIVVTGSIERPTDSCLCCGSHSTTRAFFGALPADDRVVVADLEAGLGDLIWAQPGAGDHVLVIADGSAKARDIAFRTVQVAHSMGVRHVLGVANRCADEDEAGALAEALGVHVVSIPEDPEVERASALGVSPLDASPTSSAMVAIGNLAASLAADPAGQRK